MRNELRETELLICVPLTKEQLDKELEKGMEDIRAGRVYSADEVEAEMRIVMGYESAGDQ